MPLYFIDCISLTKNGFGNYRSIGVQLLKQNQR
jgi:hypothetical protein